MSSSNFIFRCVALVLSLSFAASAHANNQCLSQVSAGELLQELNRRLDSGSVGHVPSGNFSVTFLCAGNAEIKTTVTNLQSGALAQDSLATGNWDTCNNTAKLLNQKIGNKPLASARIFAVCAGNAQIFRTLIGADGTVKRLDAQATGNWQVCQDTAAQINQALR